MREWLTEVSDTPPSTGSPAPPSVGPPTLGGVPVSGVMLLSPLEGERRTRKHDPPAVRTPSGRHGFLGGVLGVLGVLAVLAVLGVLGVLGIRR